MTINSNLLLQSISDAIFILDIDGYIKFANHAASSITGFPINELVKKHLSVLYNNDTLKTEYELSLGRKRGRFISEGWRAKKDGSRFWGEITLSVVSDEKDEMGFGCLLRDVTEKKNEELDLRKSEENYRLMVEAVKDYGIFMLSPTGHIVTWNQGAQNLKGYSQNEIVGKHFSTFYTAEDLEDKKPERELKIAIETGKYEEEGWRVKKNGSVFWANIVITSLFNEENQLVGFSKVTRDLTGRKENEENLKQSEERYRSLVEQVLDYGIFMMDEKGRIISWNEGAKKLKGYTFDEIVGKYFSIFYPEEDLLNGKPALELKVARAEGKYEEEGWRKRKDGTLFWANVVITAVYNTAGILIGFSKVTRDLTERKEAERILRDSYERYRKLSEELKVTNNELTYANGELEQFTSIVSHDLQEPIRTIKSFLKLTQQKLNQGQYDNLATYINKSINAANRMRELIQNLLHYSQLSKDEVAMEKIEVKELIGQALQNLKSAIDACRAQVTIETEVDVVYGDGVQLVQLIQNLVSNALKFTAADVPKVRIRCEKEKGGTIRFAVSDNGIGIDKDDMNKVFEIFRRLDTAWEYPGSGIGLAICKKIVERHGGKIWPESAPGKGTTFYFTLNQEIKEEVLAV
jgi:PAS domain S-box-containing protein